MAMKLGMCNMSVAGQFYPATAEELHRKIEKIIAAIRSERNIDRKPVRALILPHAGYDYSAMTAIKGLMSVKTELIKRVVLMAPSHRYGFSGAAYAGFDSFETPLRPVRCDIEGIAKLAAAKDRHFFDLPKVFSGEHALEVQLPLLQYFLGDFEMIPLIIGQNTSLVNSAVSQALKQFWLPDTLWVVSSDFTHFGRSFGYLPFQENISEQLRRLDLEAIDKILALDAEGFAEYIRDTGATICGHCPIEIMLRVAEAVTPELIDYANTGEMFNDFSHSVSYASIAFVEKGEA